MLYLQSEDLQIIGKIKVVDYYLCNDTFIAYSYKNKALIEFDAQLIDLCDIDDCQEPIDLIGYDIDFSVGALFH